MQTTMVILRGILAACVLATTSSLHAQSYGPDYRCTVERMEESNAGTKNSRADFYKGKTFVVHRRSGLMTGGVGELKNSYFDDQKPQIIDYGQQGVNAFKAVTTQTFEGSGGSNVYVLVINEYIDESIKPFTFLANDRVWFGRCEHSR